MSNSNPNKSTRFKPGVSGNLLGRPKGTLESFMVAKRIVMEVFMEGQEELREDLRKKFKQSPTTYLMKIMAPLMPKEIDVAMDEENTRLVFNIHKAKDKDTINITPKENTNENNKTM